MPKREIDQDDILDLIACASDYGHTNSILMGTLVAWAWPITDEDIDRRAAWFVSEEAKASGYCEEDAEESRRRLVEARKRFAPETSHV